MISNSTPTNSKKKEISFQPIQYIEQKFFSKVQNETTTDKIVKTDSDLKKIQVGKQIKIAYLILEGNKERIQYFEGLIISKKNKGFTKTFTLRRTVQGIGVEQVFFIHSPKIQSITERQTFKVRRAKLYFVRSLYGKAAKLKTKV